MTELDVAYAERNMVVLGLAALAQSAGCLVGKAVDASEPEWPVLLIDLPEGQVSWHLPVGDMPESMPDYPGEWDGHDTPEKYARLLRAVRARWP